MMITLRKVKAFEKCKADTQRFAFWYSIFLSGKEFYVIQKIVSDLKLIENGLAVDTYKEEVSFMMWERFDNSTTIDYLKQIAAR